MMYKNDGTSKSTFSVMLKLFEFGFFFRVLQVFITPLTYFCFWALRRSTYPNTTAVFDTIMCFTYAFIILMIVFLILYVLNFIRIDMADMKSLQRYGSLYEHVKFRMGSKLITNETLFRTILKVMIAGLHAFGFMDATSVCVTGMILYFAFGTYLIISFRINGLYEDIYIVYKMILFHFFMAGNYIFALAQIPQAG
jgi:hypothetical protein